jgi:hypothetical protein
VRLVAHMWNASQGHAAYTALWSQCKAMLTAGKRLRVVIEDESRTVDQNAKFHAICSDLERAKVPWFGKPRNAAAWKVLLVSGHAVATKEGAEVIPGLEGEFVNVRESTALMSKARGSSLIEYALAFCAQHGVETKEIA